jgi:hypothetical protein
MSNSASPSPPPPPPGPEEPEEFLFRLSAGRGEFPLTIVPSTTFAEIERLLREAHPEAFPADHSVQFAIYGRYRKGHEWVGTYRGKRIILSVRPLPLDPSRLPSPEPPD